MLVGELVSWIVDLCTAEDEAVKHTQELNKIEEEAAKTYIQEQIALEDNIKTKRKSRILTTNTAKLLDIMILSNNGSEY